MRVTFGLFMGLRGCGLAFVEGGLEVCELEVR